MVLEHAHYTTRLVVELVVAHLQLVGCEVNVSSKKLMLFFRTVGPAVIRALPACLRLRLRLRLSCLLYCLGVVVVAWLAKVAFTYWLLMRLWAVVGWLRLVGCLGGVLPWPWRCAASFFPFFPIVEPLEPSWSVVSCCFFWLRTLLSVAEERWNADA